MTNKIDYDTLLAPSREAMNVVQRTLLNVFPVPTNPTKALDKIIPLRDAQSAALKEIQAVVDSGQLPASIKICYGNCK